MGISDGWYRSSMGVIVISLRKPRCAEDNFGCTWQHQEALATSVGALTTSLESSGNADNYFGNANNMTASTNSKPGSTWDRWQQAWEHLESL